MNDPLSDADLGLCEEELSEEETKALDRDIRISMPEIFLMDVSSEFLEWSAGICRAIQAQ
jgi:hypothetical protein